MKNGKVFAKMIQDKRVRTITVGEKTAVVHLAEGFYAKIDDRGVQHKVVKSAHEAGAFIRSAIAIPAPKEGYHVVFNLMSGLPVEIAHNTPLACNPASETYWSM